VTAENIFWYAVLFLFLFGGSIATVCAFAAGFVQHLQARRHRFKLRMAKEKTLQEQAKAKMVEEQNRKAALNLRAAELEIERFDRHIPGAAPMPRLPSGVDSTDVFPQS